MIRGPLSDIVPYVGGRLVAMACFTCSRWRHVSISDVSALSLRFFLTLKEKNSLPLGQIRLYECWLIKASLPANMIRGPLSDIVPYVGGRLVAMACFTCSRWRKGGMLVFLMFLHCLSSFSSPSSISLLLSFTSSSVSIFGHVFPKSIL